MFRIRVPATSANIGAGFDCLGMALSLYNVVEVEPSAQLRVEIHGEGKGSIPENGSNLVYKAYRRTMERMGLTPGNLTIRQYNQIPSTRGLGSSSTAVVAGVLAAEAISGKALPKEEKLLIATQIEGHPDNVAPALYGGFVAAMGGTHDARCLSFSIPQGLMPVAMVPDYELATSKARAALPKEVPFKDAVFNVARASYLTAAMAKGDIDGIFSVLEDRLHQPYRAPLIRGFQEIMAMCTELGCPGYLSGAGPTLMALCHEAEVARFTAYIDPCLSKYGHWQIMALSPDNDGAVVERCE